MATYKVACIPGDGIGGEVIAEGKKVIDAAGEKDGFEVQWTDFDFGAEKYLRTHQLVTENDLKGLAGYKAIYFGAVGDPRVETGILERGIVLAVRFYFDQFVNLRPVKLYPGVQSPLRSKGEKEIDFVCIRENTEDLYVGLGDVVSGSSVKKINFARKEYEIDFEISARAKRTKNFAYQLGIITELGAERVIDYAFKYASQHQRQKVSSADKANVMPQTYGLWRKTFAHVALSYPRIQAETLFADATAMWFINHPERFQVLVTPNLIGDILTDLGAAIQGGMGMAPAGNINPTGISMFEPIHGSAPSYKGKNVSNPIATILAGAMMLDHLGLKSSAKRIDDAVRLVLEEGKVRTYDLGGTSRTSDVGSAVADRLLRSA